VWGFDGLGSAVRQALTMGLSGISTWGSDIGGFFALGDDQLTPELLTRWVQFGAVSGVMRTQADGIDIPEKARPQVWDADQIANWRRYAKLRTQLYPYLAAADARYQDNGMPIMRHLALQFPADPKAIGREDEFMFGPDLLAAPVLKPGATERELYLPRGRWAELWRAVRYRAKSGGLKLGEVRLHKGKREYSADAALDELPLMVRAGALIPLLEPNVDTLANRYATPEQVSLAEGKGKVDLLAFPRGRSGGRAFHGDRLLSREKRNRWKLTIRGVTERRWKLDASLATLKHRIRPRCVEIDGEALPRKRWSYSPEAQRLRLEVRAKRTKIVVRSRCG
jgi:alpha-glucosidase (family GH31 glycosyl hydrolase)